jgi:pilus assembly protein CpaB
MNDLRSNMYGGARYPAPAVVGSFGSGVGGAIANSMARSGAMMASATQPRRIDHSTRASRRKAPSAPADTSSQIEVWRGTTINQVKVGG